MDDVAGIIAIGLNADLFDHHVEFVGGNRVPGFVVGNNFEIDGHGHLQGDSTGQPADVTRRHLLRPILPDIAEDTHS